MARGFIGEEGQLESNSEQYSAHIFSSGIVKLWMTFRITSIIRRYSKKFNLYLLVPTQIEQFLYRTQSLREVLDNRFFDDEEEHVSCNSM